MNLTYDQQIELLGLMKHWVVSTQSDNTINDEYMITPDSKSMEQYSLGNPYELVEMIEDLRSLLYENNYKGFNNYLSSNVGLSITKGTRSNEFRYYLNLLFDNMVNQVNNTSQKNNSKYKVLHINFVDFLEKLPKRK